MPLRDHFRPPVESKHSWDELHGMWPAVIVQHLFQRVEAVRVPLGAIDDGQHFLQTCLDDIAVLD